MALAVDITSPGGAFSPAAKGDLQNLTANFTIGSGSTSLVCNSAAPFVSGDTGKSFYLGGAGASGGFLIGTITFVSSSQVTLSVAASTVLSTQSELLGWGTDDAPAFAAFNVWAVANQGSDQVQLTIPTGKNCLFASDVALFWAKGIKNLLVSAYGATITSGGGGFFLGGAGQIQSSAHSARLFTVSAGSSTVRLNPASASQPADNPTLASCVALFTVGQWVLMTGFDLQGLWQAPFGFPSNQHFFEYVQITVINPVTGDITFSAPLKYTYKDTWPNYNSGSQFEVDNGGPATLYSLDPSWDTVVEYQGLTFAGPLTTVGNLYSNGRSVTYRDATFMNTITPIPSQNSSYTMINPIIGARIIEADKLVGTYEIDNGTIEGIDFQSSSIDTLIMTGTTLRSFIHGTPKKTIMSNVTMGEFRPGAFGYGRSDSLTCTNCVIGSFSYLGILDKGVGDGGFNPGNGYTMVNGVITIPNTYNAQRWAVPATNVMWQGAFGLEFLFKVVDVTQDATNTYVQTNWPGGFPTSNGGNHFLQVHPAPQCTFTNCTGNIDVVDLSQATAGAPIYSYSKRTYSGLSSGGQPIFLTWGKVVSISFNVTALQSGANVNPMGQFHNFTMKADETIFDYIPFIDLGTIANRIITPSNVTGQQSGDANLSIPEAVWLNGGNAFMNTNMVASSITIEIRTDQGVSGNVVPLRLRVHS